MPFITQEQIKKKSEHHDGLLSDLQELSLHQQNLEKIDVLHCVCRKLEIQYLQNNLIGRMENQGKQKYQKYLNMALNNITKIENVGGCEKLERLDLTVNFIPLENLEESIVELRELVHFEEMYLTGNPCTDWPMYRQFVISQQKPQKRLDGKDVTVTERQEADKQKKDLQSKLRMECARMKDMRKQRELFNEEEPKSNAFTPAMRVEMYQEEQEQQRLKDEEKNKPSEFAPAPDLMKAAYDKQNQREQPREDGSLPAQRNTARYEFKLETRKTLFCLTVKVPKFLDTSAMTVDIHPLWVQCIIKGKNLLVHMDEEVSVEGTSVQRVTGTGELVLTMPKQQYYTGAPVITHNYEDVDNHNNNNNNNNVELHILRPSGIETSTSSMLSMKKERVNKKLEEERAQAEAALQKARLDNLQAIETEKEQKRKDKKAFDDAELARLKLETDLDLDDLPDFD